MATKLTPSWWRDEEEVDITGLLEDDTTTDYYDLFQEIYWEFYEESRRKNGE